MLIINDELMNEFEEIKRKIGSKELEEDYIFDEISNTIEDFCTDPYTKGYLTRKFETDSESFWNSEELFEETYYFIKEMKKMYEKKA